MVKLGQDSGTANKVVIVDNGIGRKAGFGRRVGLKTKQKNEEKFKSTYFLMSILTFDSVNGFLWWKARKNEIKTLFYF
jgi:hypothetical protein